MFFTDKVCRNYLRDLSDLRYGDINFLSTFQKIVFSEDDFLEEQSSSFVSKDFLKLALKNKVCKIKPYLSDNDVSFFKFTLNEKELYI